MASLNCFRPSRKKKEKKKVMNCFLFNGYGGGRERVNLYDKEENLNTLHVKLDHLQASSEATELRSTSFSVAVPFRIPGSSRCKVKVMNHESPVAGDPYEGEDEHDEASRLERDSEFNFQAPSENPNQVKIQGSKSCSSLDMNDGEFDFQACFGNQNEEKGRALPEVNSSCSLNIYDDVENSNTEVMFEMNASGHVSDPGTGKARFWASPELRRSCSNLAMRSVSLELEDPLLVSKCKSYEDMQRLAEMHATDGGAASPTSIRTRCSADKVILKKHSSSQILPSGSRKLWWKLFLWSHRNLHRTASSKPLLSEAEADPVNQHGGYSSDIVEPKHTTGSRKLRSPSSLTEESGERGKRSSMDDRNWDGFYGFQNQWFAFPPDSSPLWRVDEWVKEASSQPPCQVDKDDHHSEDDIAFPSSPDNGASPPRDSSHLPRPSATNMVDDVSHANTVIRSLNSNSTVAHISGLGLGAIPSISLFSSLRSVNLSGNLIVQITPGSLPKGLHVLNLSRNKISTIEGLRELTRLRVLDLSYNRISRIGQGLSNCTLVKELHLAGNKISMVEGLHRLLKLTVLDLSFNKITTAKAFGQLVANYNSLIALNLLGNPIQSNMSDDLLRKTLCSLLPKLALLNKQPINPQKAREIRADANAKAALGNSGWNTRRKVVRKVAAPGASSSHSIRRSAVSTSQRNKHRVRSHSRHHSTLKDKA
ncbi:hypothetical protein C2S53_000855 [Perilla frutescens var. hirtella]|uniref:Uncharacterized protein n=1 Tax=Perilla frutescens var. hirtella TaxID=608512 RepID=A0AAD4JPQ5_PERFH|nr:hypothetical protein C2S53_000855 [Perilla frutescens var. hirtella]